MKDQKLQEVILKILVLKMRKGLLKIMKGKIIKI